MPEKIEGLVESGIRRRKGDREGERRREKVRRKVTGIGGRCTER